MRTNLHPWWCFFQVILSFILLFSTTAKLVFGPFLSRQKHIVCQVSISYSFILQKAQLLMEIFSSHLRRVLFWQKLQFFRWSWDILTRDLVLLGTRYQGWVFFRGKLNYCPQRKCTQSKLKLTKHYICTFPFWLRSFKNPLRYYGPNKLIEIIEFYLHQFLVSTHFSSC